MIESEFALKKFITNFALFIIGPRFTLFGTEMENIKN